MAVGVIGRKGERERRRKQRRGKTEQERFIDIATDLLAALSLI